MSDPDLTHRLEEDDSQAALRREVAALAARVAELERAFRWDSPGPGTHEGYVPPTEARGTPQIVASIEPAAEGADVRSGPSPLFPQPIASHTSMKRKQSLESRIGSFFLNRIGVVAVMVGMAWFLKLAFDRNWIGPGLRVLIELAVAVGLVVWSERFRRRGYGAFSYSLKALGTGIAYLSLWAAYSVYGLVSAGLAFEAMVVVTAANVGLAWWQDSELLAGYALVGGLATPALLSTGQNHEMFLFSYLLLLDLGALLLCGWRPWNRLIAGSLVGTLLYFGTWWAAYYTPAAFGLTGWFLLLFFLVFTAAPLVALHITGRRFRARLRSGDAEAGAADPGTGGYDRAFHGALVVGLPLAVNGATLMAAMTWAGSRDLYWLRSWLALALAMVSLGIDLLVRGMEGGVASGGLRGAKEAMGSPARPAADLLADIHFGLAIFFVALAAWLEYYRHAMGLSALIGCWLAETIMLATVITLFPPHHHRPATTADHVTLPRVYTTLMVGLASVSLVMMEWLEPPPYFTRPIWNLHCVTYAAGLAVFAGTAWLCRKSIAAQGRTLDSGATTPARVRKAVGDVQPGSLYFIAGYAAIAFNIVALIAGAVQIHLYWMRDDLQRSAMRMAAAGPHTVGFSYSVWFMVYGAVLMAVGFLRRSSFLRWQALILLAFAIGKVFVVDSARLSQGYRVMSFLGLGALLLAISFAYQRDWLALRGKD